MNHALRLPLMVALTMLALLAFSRPAGAAVSYQVTSAVLYVTLTDDSDATLVCTAGTVRINGGNTGAVCASLQGISVGGGDGANTIDLSGVAAPAFDPAKIPQVQVYGGDGEDIIDGSHFVDYLSGGPHDDTIRTNGVPAGSAGHDTVYPDAGSDTVIGSNSGFDEIAFSGSSLQLLDGPSGSGQLKTLEASELDVFESVDSVYLLGTSGADVIDAIGYSRSGLTIYADAGDDEVWGPNSKPAGAEVSISGNSGDDIVNGGNAGEFLSGAYGDDTLSGGGGDDSLWGQDGSDALSGGAGDDTAMTIAVGETTVVGATALSDAEGTDSLSPDIETVSVRDEYDSGQNKVDASAWPGRLIAYTGGGDDELIAGQGPSELRGGDGADRLVGGPGGDSLFGDAGDDRLDGGPGADGFSAGEGADEVRSLDGIAEVAIDCGGDADVAYSDADDTAPASCEAVSHQLPVTPAPSEPQRPAGPPPPATQTPTPVTPVPGDVAAPALGLSRGKLSSAGVFTIEVGCPAAETTCTGKAALASARRVGKKRVVFGARTFTISGGKTAVLRIKLSKRNLKLLRTHGKIASTLTVAVRDAAGNRATVKQKLTLTGRRPAAPARTPRR